MPNWCTNTLTVVGSVRSLRVFGSAVTTVTPAEQSEIIHRPARVSLLDFNKILPVPAELNEEQAYSWRVHNWGTKWPADAFVETGPGSYVYNFDTAWSPPSEIFMAKLGEMFPRLRF